MELSIDTASETASLALSEEGKLRAALTWQCRRNHTVELLGAIDKLLQQAGITQAEISAVFVCLGPGMYTGLRVGISVAQGLAYSRGLPALGIGRLELDAYPYAFCRLPVLPLHWAGRGEVAWALYQPQSDGLREQVSARLSSPEEVLERAPGEVIFCGEVKPEFAERIEEKLPGARISPDPVWFGRAVHLARLGSQRLREQGGQPPSLLRPLYLRDPAIGPQTERK